jgi:hypothetical protein
LTAPSTTGECLPGCKSVAVGGSLMLLLLLLGPPRGVLWPQGFPPPGAGAVDL